MSRSLLTKGITLGFYRQLDAAAQQFLQHSWVLKTNTSLIMSLLRRARDNARPEIPSTCVLRQPTLSDQDDQVQT